MTAADGIRRISEIQGPHVLSLSLSLPVAAWPMDPRHGTALMKQILPLTLSSARCHVASASALDNTWTSVPSPSECLQSSCGKFVILNGLLRGGQIAFHYLRQNTQDAHR